MGKQFEFVTIDIDLNQVSRRSIDYVKNSISRELKIFLIQIVNTT